MIDLAGADLSIVCVLSDNVATTLQFMKNENWHAVHH